jgi:pantoate kinase
VPCAAYVPGASTTRHTICGDVRALRADATVRRACPGPPRHAKAHTICGDVRTVRADVSGMKTKKIILVFKTLSKFRAK